MRAFIIFLLSFNSANGGDVQKHGRIGGSTEWIRKQQVNSAVPYRVKVLHYPQTVTAPIGNKLSIRKLPFNKVLINKAPSNRVPISKVPLRYAENFSFKPYELKVQIPHAVTIEQRVPSKHYNYLVEKKVPSQYFIPSTSKYYWSTKTVPTIDYYGNETKAEVMPTLNRVPKYVFYQKEAPREEIIYTEEYNRVPSNHEEINKQEVYYLPQVVPYESEHVETTEAPKTVHKEIPSSKLVTKEYYNSNGWIPMEPIRDDSRYHYYKQQETQVPKQENVSYSYLKFIQGKPYEITKLQAVEQSNTEKNPLLPYAEKFMVPYSERPNFSVHMIPIVQKQNVPFKNLAGRKEKSRVPFNHKATPPFVDKNVAPVAEKLIQNPPTEYYAHNPVGQLYAEKVPQYIEKPVATYRIAPELRYVEKPVAPHKINSDLRNNGKPVVPYGRINEVRYLEKPMNKSISIRPMITYAIKTVEDYTQKPTVSYENIQAVPEPEVHSVRFENQHEEEPAEALPVPAALVQEPAGYQVNEEIPNDTNIDSYKYSIEDQRVNEHSTVYHPYVPEVPAENYQEVSELPIDSGSKGKIYEHLVNKAPSDTGYHQYFKFSQPQHSISDLRAPTIEAQNYYVGNKEEPHSLKYKYNNEVEAPSKLLEQKRVPQQYQLKNKANIKSHDSHFQNTGDLNSHQKEVPTSYVNHRYSFHPKQEHSSNQEHVSNQEHIYNHIVPPTNENLFLINYQPKEEGQSMVPFKSSGESGKTLSQAVYDEIIKMHQGNLKESVVYHQSDNYHQENQQRIPKNNIRGNIRFPGPVKNEEQKSEQNGGHESKPEFGYRIIYHSQQEQAQEGRYHQIQPHLEYHQVQSHIGYHQTPQFAGYIQMQQEGYRQSQLDKDKEYSSSNREGKYYQPKKGDKINITQGIPIVKQDSIKWNKKLYKNQETDQNKYSHQTKTLEKPKDDGGLKENTKLYQRENIENLHPKETFFIRGGIFQNDDSYQSENLNQNNNPNLAKGENIYQNGSGYHYTFPLYRKEEIEVKEETNPEKVKAYSYQKITLYQDPKEGKVEDLVETEKIEKNVNVHENAQSYQKLNLYLTNNNLKQKDNLIPEIVKEQVNPDQGEKVYEGNLYQDISHLYPVGKSYQTVNTNSDQDSKRHKSTNSYQDTNLYQTPESFQSSNSNEEVNSHQGTNLYQTPETFQNTNSYQEVNSYQDANSYQETNSFQNPITYQAHIPYQDQNSNTYQDPNSYQIAKPHQSGKLNQNAISTDTSNSYENDNLDSSYQNPISYQTLNVYQNDISQEDKKIEYPKNKKQESIPNRKPVYQVENHTLYQLKTKVPYTGKTKESTLPTSPVIIPSNQFEGVTELYQATTKATPRRSTKMSKRGTVKSKRRVNRFRIINKDQHRNESARSYGLKTDIVGSTEKYVI